MKGDDGQVTALFIWVYFQTFRLQKKQRFSRGRFAPRIPGGSPPCGSMVLFKSSFFHLLTVQSETWCFRAMAEQDNLPIKTSWSTFSLNFLEYLKDFLFRILSFNFSRGSIMTTYAFSIQKQDYEGAEKEDSSQRYWKWSLNSALTNFL